MEVTVIETGDLPPSTIMSFHTGTTRRHAQMEKNMAISLSHVGSEPVRVDLMSQIGSHTFDMVPGQDVYDVPISSGEAGGGEVKLKFQIREAAPKGDACEASPPARDERGEVGEGVHPGSPSRKLQTALMMRSYLDHHDVLRQMQELLQEMVMHRPQDPIEYMIQRLEEVCRESQGVEVIDGDAPPPAPVVPGAEEESADVPAKATARSDDNEEDDDDDDDADEVEDPLPPAPVKRERKCSVSEEAYGAFNQRKAYEPKVIPKDDHQKERIKAVLRHCWMFRTHTPENINLIVDAMSEKVVPAGAKLISQGDAGETMWVIEEGVLECFKTIDGQEKLVKGCQRGDVFGELALLYNCPRAASVVSREKCVLWELDRETFKAICYEAAQQDQPAYEGFVAPGCAKEGAAADEEDNHSEGEVPEPKQVVRLPAGRRREGVSAEATKDNDNSWVPPVYEKSIEERQQLSDIIRTSRDSKLHMLFGIVLKETFEKIVDAMQLKPIAEGENVIKQGDVGDYFYIVKSGDFDIFVQKGEDPPKKVFQAVVGFAFGELALLYNAPRSATITAAVQSEVWCLDRTAFRNLVVRSAEARFNQHVEFLNGVDVFQVLNENERASLAEVLEEEEFEDDEAIVEQGEKDDKMFILLRGKAVACIKGEQGEVEVMNYSIGNYFGEIALLSGEPRKASVYAVGACACLYITRPTFLRVLGSLSSLLERNIGKYEKYQDAIANAVTEKEEEQPLERDQHEKGLDREDDDFDGSAVKPKTKVVNRKRARAAEAIGNITKKANIEAGEEPSTLADKVAQDFKNAALVTPSEHFAVAGTQMMMYGGVVPGQKFTMDKILHVRGGGAPERRDEDDVYSWNGVTKLKHVTEIGVMCQKGQKSPSDPTPNQDNFFVHHKDGVSFYGVCDGHGPFGHLVSFRLVQTLPYFLTHNEHFGKDWDVALREAFLAAQKDLCDFCAEHSINIEASGAAGSVLVLEEQTVHIAFIGDARVMLGSWNRRDSRMIFCTKDHKPGDAGERQRLEANGSEVREIDPGNFRIYLPGSNFPGLTMSRAFGDTACGGVLRVPEYHKFLMQPTDQWYAIVASDGIWEFMEGEEVCTLTAKKLRMKGPRETINFLVNASRKRWAHCCGDYCDDITAVLVQWNAGENQGSKNNHSLTVKRSE